MEAANTTLLFPSNAVRRIVRAFVADEAAFTAAAVAAGWDEPLETVQERFLNLQRSEDFNRFFSFLSRGACDLISPCHWLVFGPQLDLGNEASVPTLGQLLRLIQLVRERQPGLFDFTRQLIAGSVLGKVVGVEPAEPAIRPVDVSSATVGVAG